MKLDWSDGTLNVQKPRAKPRYFLNFFEIFFNIQKLNFNDYKICCKIKYNKVC